MRRVNRNDRRRRGARAGQKYRHHQPWSDPAEPIRRADKDAARMSERHVGHLLAMTDAYRGMRPDATVNLLKFVRSRKEFARREAPLTLCEIERPIPVRLKLL